MSLNTDAKTQPISLLDDIERRVSELFSAQKNEVEQSLIVKISREKEEAQRRIEAVNREFGQVRGLLDQHKSTMAELESTEHHLRGEIRGHFERAVNYQKMMENAAALAGDELEKIGGLHQELEKVRTKAESEYNALKRHLGGYAGIMAQLPAPPPKAESEVDWVTEIGKLRQVRDLMATLRHDGLGDHVGEGPSAPAAETAEELAASLGLLGPEENGVRDEAELARVDVAWMATHDGGNGQPHADEPEQPPVEFGAGPIPEFEAAAPAESPAEPPAEALEAEDAGPSPEEAAVLESLARYFVAEPVGNGIDIAFFKSDTGAWLDAQSFMAAIQNIIEGARQLHVQLTETTSVKDLFLLKQEILNQQELLRKLVFRAVRFCDKDGGHLPASLNGVINSRGMKDIVERLTMANWSDPSDFRPFVNELNSLKRSFEANGTSGPAYVQAVLDEVEGRLS